MLDDSFISFRYAENLVSGHGLVYNPGEIVEGYTCFLWVILLAIGTAIGIPAPLFSQILGSLLLIGTVLLIFYAYRFIKSIDSNTSAAAALFLGTCGIFGPWASSGMEVGMFTFLLLFSILLYIHAGEASNGKRSFALLGILLGTLAMTRPEGILICSILLMDRSWWKSELS